MAKTLYVLNGPNMNLLGSREPEKYGRATSADVEKTVPRDRQALRPRGGTCSASRTSRANWSTGSEEAQAKKAAGLIINPAGYTTTSIAILDALLTLKMPIVEIHVTNIHQRETFRHNSYVSKAAKAVTAVSALMATHWRSPGWPAWSAQTGKMRVIPKSGNRFPEMIMRDENIDGML